MSTSGFSSLSVCPWSLKWAWRGRKRELVGRIAQVVNHQLELGKAGVQQGLEVPVVLHPLGQRVADQDDPISLAEHQLGFRGGVSLAPLEQPCSKAPRRRHRSRIASRDRARLVIAVRASVTEWIESSGREPSPAPARRVRQPRRIPRISSSLDRGRDGLSNGSWRVLRRGGTSRQTLSCVPDAERAVKGAARLPEQAISAGSSASVASQRLERFGLDTSAGSPITL